MSLSDNMHHLDAIGTALTSRRSPQQGKGKKREREREREREQEQDQRAVLVHRNQKKAKNNKENEERYRSILKEQDRFHDCEIKFLPLIRHWEEAIRNKNSTQLTRIYKELIDEYKMESFTAPFFEEYDVRTLIKDSKRLVFDKDLVNQVVIKFSRTYGIDKRNVPKGFKARKGCNNTMKMQSKTKDPPEQYVDIFIVRGECLVDNEKLRTILLRVMKLGRPTYKDQFIGAIDTDSMIQIASSVFGAIRNTEFPPVRFLRKSKNNPANEWVEVERKSVRHLISRALSVLVKLIQPMCNDIFLMEQSKRTTIRKVLDEVLLSGTPHQYRQRFRKELETENRPGQLEIIENMLAEIRKRTNPSVRFLRQLRATDNCWVEEAETTVTSIVQGVLENIVTEVRVPREEDVLQFGFDGRHLSKFDSCLNNERFRNMLQTEGYYDDYRKALLRHDDDRVEIMIRVAEAVLERVQKLVLPSRFLSQSLRTGQWIELMRDDQKLFSINRILWNMTDARNDNHREIYSIDTISPERDDILLSFQGRRQLTHEDVEDVQKIRCLASKIGRYDGPRKFIFCVKILNPYIRFIRRKTNGEWTRVTSKVIETELVKAFQQNTTVKYTSEPNDDSHEQPDGPIILTKEDCLISGRVGDSWTIEDKDKLLYLITNTRQQQYYVDQYQKCASRLQKGGVAHSLLSVIETMNSKMRFLRKDRNNGEWGICHRESVVLKVFQILRDLPAISRKRESITGESFRSDKKTQEHDAEIEQDDTNTHYDEPTQSEAISATPFSTAGDEHTKAQSKSQKKRDKQTASEPKIKQELTEEQTASLIDDFSPFEETKAIKQEPEEELEQQQQPQNYVPIGHEIRDEEFTRTNNIANIVVRNVKREVEDDDEVEIIDIDMNDMKEDQHINDEEGEIIEIDMSDDGSVVVDKKMKEEQHRDDDQPPRIETTDVDISDVSIGGDFESSISKLETSTIIGQKANAIRIVRGGSMEVTLPPSSLSKCLNGGDVLRSAAMQAVSDKSRIFIFGDDVKKAIYDEKKIVRYEFRGQNPTSAQFRSLPMDDILRGQENTVLIKMSVDDVEGGSEVSLAASLF